MADDPNPTLSAELMAARAVLAPQIRGLADLLTTTTSGDLHARIVDVNAMRHHRDDLLVAALAARDAYIAALGALEADGYPALPNVQIEPALLDEMRAEESDIESAVAIFEDALVVDFNADVPVVDVSQPVPSQT